MLRKWTIAPSQNDLVVYFKVNPLLLTEVFLKFRLTLAEQTWALVPGSGLARLHRICHEVHEMKTGGLSLDNLDSEK